MTNNNNLQTQSPWNPVRLTAMPLTGSREMGWVQSPILRKAALRAHLGARITAPTSRLRRSEERSVALAAVQSPPQPGKMLSRELVSRPPNTNRRRPEICGAVQLRSNGRRAPTTR